MKYTLEPSENASRMFALAKSDLSVARVGKTHDDTLYETLCTLCQQAIEKSLKSLMIHHNIPYPRVHSIEILIDEMEKQQIILPGDIKTLALESVTTEGGFSVPLKTPINFGTVVSLSEYAEDRRYAISVEPLIVQEYTNVFARCEKIVEWVEEQIKK